MTKQHLYNAIKIFGCIVIVLTLFRFVSLDFWWVRIFDFPHVQLTCITATALALYFIKFDYKWLNDYIIIGGIIACFIFQISKIYPYTPLSSTEIGNVTEDEQHDSLKIYVANVLQKNKEPRFLIDEIKTANADVIILTETDKIWQKNIAPIVNARYPYQVEVPQDNTYGMLLYSRKELVNPKVMFMVDDGIPSIHTKVKLNNTQLVQLYAIHPTPPMPQHNPTSSDRDKEMMLTAQLASKSELPVIVTGDFNDVAWSQTTTLFQRISGLLDMRKGRGFFNTFNANNALMRWPLDHMFVSEHFRVIEIGLGNDINSDHFPFYASLSFEPEKAAEQKMPPPTKDELSRMQEQIKGKPGFEMIDEITN